METDYRTKRRIFELNPITVTLFIAFKALNKEEKSGREIFDNLIYTEDRTLMHVRRLHRHVWDKLPKHVKADSEIRTYRRCDEHYNQSWQRMHINGPAPKIKDCSEYRHRAAVCRIEQ